MFSCNLRFRLIFLHGCSRTHCVASLRAVPVGRISYNLYFDCKHVRSVTCDLINEYTFFLLRINPLYLATSGVARRHLANKENDNVHVHKIGMNAMEQTEDFEIWATRSRMWSLVVSAGGRIAIKCDLSW